MESKLISYFKERENLDYYENEDFCMLYRIEDDYCYLQDAYVVPEKRNNRKGDEVVYKASNIAKESGCKYLLTSVDTKVNCLASLSVIKRNNFQKYKEDGSFVIFIKEVE